MIRILSYVILGALLAVLVSLLQGCSVNVIVAPHATLGVSSDLSQTATQRNVGTYLEAEPEFDCIAGPAADVCQ
jgi:hypothetical protein